MASARAGSGRLDTLNPQPQAECPANRASGRIPDQLGRNRAVSHPGWSGSAWPASGFVGKCLAGIRDCRQWCRRSPSVADGCPGQPSPAHQACASRRLHAQRRSVRPIASSTTHTAIIPARANPRCQPRAVSPACLNPASSAPRTSTPRRQPRSCSRRSATNASISPRTSVGRGSKPISRMAACTCGVLQTLLTRPTAW